MVSGAQRSGSAPPGSAKPGILLRVAGFEPVVVRKLKFDGSVKYVWPAHLIEERPDWLIAWHDPAIHQKRGDATASEDEPAHVLHYCGLGRPLTVLFAFEKRGGFLEAKCDAALPAVREGERVDFVDLDLDVVVLPGGSHYVRDQEVFAERSVSMGYTEEAKRQAHVGILHALRMIRRGLFPFDGHAEALMRRLLDGKG